MLMVGEATARYAIEEEIPFPFATQKTPDREIEKEDIPSPGPDEENYAAAFAILRTLARSKVKVRPAPHAGIGLPVYSRVTSPLRRYQDLLAHQQLRAHHAGAPRLTRKELIEHVGASEVAVRAVNRAENLARRHWTLVYLEQHPDWCGRAVVVKKRGRSSQLLIPSLAFETRIHLPGDPSLNSVLELKIRDVNLPKLDAYFEVTSFTAA
jgi:exoribonuclease-2